jgi:hypothetical protein
MLETYKIDDRIYEFVKNVYSPERLNVIKNLFTILNNFNQIELNTNKFTIIKLETELVEIMLMDDIEPTQRNDIFIGKIIKEVSEYISKYGIFLSDEIKLFRLLDFLEAWFIVMTIDEDFIEQIIKMTETDEIEEELILAKILSQYTNDFTELELYTIIEDLDSDFRSNFVKYLEARMVMLNVELPVEIESIIEHLSKVDESFEKCSIIRDYRTKGYIEETFDSRLNSLYNELNKLKDNMEFIPFEIVATLMLCIDSKTNPLDYLNNSLQLSNVSYLTDDINTVDAIMLMTNNLYNTANWR